MRTMLRLTRSDARGAATSCRLGAGTCRQLPAACRAFVGIGPPPAGSAADEVGGEDAAGCSDAGEVLEAQLSQIDVASNTDKFYTIQVVHDASADTFYCIAHWGRTGTKGQTSVEQFANIAFICGVQ